MLLNGGLQTFNFFHGICLKSAAKIKDKLLGEWSQNGWMLWLRWQKRSSRCKCVLFCVLDQPTKLVAVHTFGISQELSVLSSSASPVRLRNDLVSLPSSSFCKPVRENNLTYSRFIVNTLRYSLSLWHQRKITSFCPNDVNLSLNVTPRYALVGTQNQMDRMHIMLR